MTPGEKINIAISLATFVFTAWKLGFNLGSIAGELKEFKEHVGIDISRLFDRVFGNQALPQFEQARRSRKS